MRSRFRLGQQGFPSWAAGAPHRLVWPSAVTGRWQLHAVDLREHTSRVASDEPSGMAAGAVDPLGRWVWWFGRHGGTGHGRCVRRPFGAGPAEIVGPPAAPTAGLVPTADGAVAARITAAGTEIGTIAADGGWVVVRRFPAPMRLVDVSADGGLISVAGAAGVQVLDRDGALIAKRPGVPWAGPWSPVPGSDRMLVRDGAAGLAAWQVRTGAVTPVLGPAATVHQEAACWFPDGAAVLVTQEERGRGRLLRAVPGGGNEPVAMPAGTIHGAAVRPDGAVWCLHSAPESPPRLRSTAGAVPAELVLPPAPPGVGYADATAGDVPLFVAVPPGPGPHTTVLMLHGGPARHDRFAYDPRVQNWVAAGFAVALVNYRGSSGYGTAWKDALRSAPGPGLAELADLRAVREHLVGSGVADPRRIALQGGSWGGYLVLLALGRDPGLWQAGVAVVPVADWVATWEDEDEQTREHDRLLFGGSPTERPGYYAQRSPLTYAERVRDPLMIVHGRRDPHCPPRQIANYVERLRELGQPPIVHAFDGGHGTLDVGEEAAQHEAQVAFVRRALAAV